MAAYFSGVVGFVGDHPSFAFTVVFLLALSEAVPVVGTLVPAPRSSLRSARLQPVPRSVPGASARGRGGRSHRRRWFIVLGRKAIPPRDLTGVAVESLSATHHAQRGVHKQIRRRQRVSGAIYSGRARLCAADRGHTANVAAPILRCQHPLRPCLGTGARVSRRAAGAGYQISEAQAPESLPSG